ncbi:hypothetical protein ACIGHE_05510 [Staphylococcus pasteuri]|uniref:hypothetical protein n=1 Tax=Staphylococcus pasteuri TaxID=45972 RepID=UPI0037CE96B8
MNNNEENNVEVIDPTDPRYKDEEHFHQNIQDDSKKRYQTYSYGCTQTGCGCTMGCGTLMFISFIITMIIYWLF